MPGGLHQRFRRSPRASKADRGKSTSREGIRLQVAQEELFNHLRRRPLGEAILKRLQRVVDGRRTPLY